MNRPYWSIELMPKSFRFFIPLLALIILLGIGFSVQTPMTSHAQDFGSGWTGSYYANANLNGAPTIAQLDTQINFNFGAGSPNSGIGIPADNFSVRWQALVNFPADGTYRFTAVYDDGIRVRIDGTTIMDDFVNNGAQKTLTADANVTGGLRDVVVEYVEFTGNALVQFYWEPISTTGGGGGAAAATEGPTATPTNTALPAIPPGALAATVIRANVLNVRDAPSLGGAVIDRILRRQTYQVVGRNEDATWFILELGGKQGWAMGYYLYINGNEFNAPIRSATNLYGLPGGFNDTGVIVQTHATMRLRAEPNIFAPQTGRITWGSFVPVAGRTAGGDWYQVLWKGTVGWMYAGFSDIREGSYSDIPVIR